MLVALHIPSPSQHYHSTQNRENDMTAMTADGVLVMGLVLGLLVGLSVGIVLQLTRKGDKT